MKRLLQLFLVALFAIVTIVPSYAKPDGEGGEPIPIHFSDPGEGDDRNDMRSFESVPMEALFNAGQGIINIIFLWSTGDVTIRLTNLTTGYMISTVVDSSVGSYILPVTGGTGLYKLLFITEDGSHYSGFFNVL